MNITAWLRAMRLQTLPVATSSLIVAVALINQYVAANADAQMNVTVTVLCFVFAILAQITSNFANEYYDYVRGGDKAGRDGFRRGVAEGDITPSAMKTAAIITIGIACVVGLCLVPTGGLWLIPIGCVIALGAFAYSAGPYPLSHHGLGELAVVIFFGIVPICMTFYLSTFTITAEVVKASVAIGLLSANVLVVNNYRDYQDDLDSDKHTLAVIMGRGIYKYLYILNGYVAILLLTGVAPLWLNFTYLVLHTLAFALLLKKKGKVLNKVLVVTSMLMLAYSLSLALCN